MAPARHTTPVTVRYADTDAMGHVNNAVYANYLEVARSDYLADLDCAFTSDVQTVVARLELDYVADVRYGDEVTVATWVTDLGGSTLDVAYEIRRRRDGADPAGDPTVAATGRTVVVTVDPESHRSRPLPETWRRNIAAFEDLE